MIWNVQFQTAITDLESYSAYPVERFTDVYFMMLGNGKHAFKVEWNFSVTVKYHIFHWEIYMNVLNSFYTGSDLSVLSGLEPTRTGPDALYI